VSRESGAIHAGGKPIYAELETRGPCVGGIRWLLEVGAALRGKAARAARRALFLVVRGESVERLKPAWFNTWFSSFVSAIPALGGLRLNPSMLRPSVLLKAALESDGRARAGRAIGQHGETVSDGYQGKFPVNQQRDELIRGFQHHFETLALAKAAETHIPYGFSEAEIQRRVQDLTPTGLGTFCKNRFGKPGFEGTKCEDPSDCAGKKCPQMEVVLTPQSAAVMQMWKTSLDSVAADWERDRPERWQSIWLPWQCLLTVVEDKASRGPLLRVWDQGTALLNQAQHQPGFNVPCPW